MTDLAVGLRTTTKGHSMTSTSGAPVRQRTTPASPGTPDVIVYTDPRSPAAEAYRTLRTNVRALIRPPGGAPLRQILMTSAGADEGKSEAIACLGIAFAQAGMRVVIVDADLRRPAQHLRFNLPNTDGLANLFGGKSPRAPTLQPTTVPNLHVLTSGTEPESPADVLASPDLDRIMDQASRDADLVLIDCPPVCAVADASVLSTRVDGVIVVVGAGVVKRDLARHARAQLDAVRANVIGLVVTNAPYNERTFASYYDEAPVTSA